MFFLNCKPVRKANSNDPSRCYVFDRGVLEDRYIFVQHQVNEGLMSHAELAEYDCYFDEIYKQVFEEPDVVIYLKADVSVMQDRVKKRSRDMESELVASEYMEALQKLYDESLMPKMKKECKNGVVLTYDTNKLGEEDIAMEIFNDLREISGLVGKK
jgi:deoxyadenosine/deoxycytidine kinase